MSVKMRLTRIGSNKKPFYRIVIMDSKTQRDGKFLDIVGTYNPLTSSAGIQFSEDKIEKWLAEGAIPSETVYNLLKRINFWEKKQLKAQGLDESAIQERIAQKKSTGERNKKKKIKKGSEASA
ncbi:MAG: 30S ribosomal protein S16 [Candidatus Delongbacteria bacterium]|nr:30S ribosomal protein S16 [Candidatus Delongbacteria bacterium]